jgi:hypothetical protein
VRGGAPDVPDADSSGQFGAREATIYAYGMRHGRKPVRDDTSDEPSFFSVPLDVLLKLIGAGSVLAYVALSVAYQRFYGQLGLSPEDLGVDQVFILARAVALTPLAILVASMVAWVSFGVRIAARAFDRPGRLIVPLAAMVVAGWALSNYRGGVPLADWVANGIGLVVPMVLICLSVLRGTTFSSVTVLALVFVTTVLGGGVNAWTAAGYRADAARSGVPVGPVTFLTLPVVDVQVSPARVIWIADKDKRPVELFPDAMMMTARAGYVGQNATTTYLLFEGSTLRLPATSVVVITDGTRESS